MGTLPGRGHVRRDARFKPLLGRSAALTWARRLLSVLTLVAIDLASLILGVMAAFAGKLLLRGDPLDFGAIWLLFQTVWYRVWLCREEWQPNATKDYQYAVKFCPELPAYGKNYLCARFRFGSHAL